MGILVNMAIEDIKDRVLLLNINQTYHEGMPEDVVLAVACRAWAVDKKRKDGAKYALVVYKDEVKGVFKIDSWHKDPVEPRKWAFKGEVAPEHIRDKYMGMRGVAWEQGQKTPFIYVNF